MNTKALAIGAVVIVLLVAGGVWLAGNQNKKTTNTEKSAMIKEEERMMGKGYVMKDEGAMEKDDKMMGNKTSDSRYVVYSKSALDQAASNRRVLYFYASWCPICRPADTDFKENSNKIPEDMVVIRVNYNDPDTDQEEKDLAKKHGITYQHTFVQIDGQGKQITKWNGGQTEELLANIK